MNAQRDDHRCRLWAPIDQLVADVNLHGLRPPLAVARSSKSCATSAKHRTAATNVEPSAALPACSHGGAAFRVTGRSDPRAPSSSSIASNGTARIHRALVASDQRHFRDETNTSSVCPADRRARRGRRPRARTPALRATIQRLGGRRQHFAHPIRRQCQVRFCRRVGRRAQRQPATSGTSTSRPKCSSGSSRISHPPGLFQSNGAEELGRRTLAAFACGNAGRGEA